MRVKRTKKHSVRKRKFNASDPIKILKLPKRIQGALDRAGIRNVGQLTGTPTKKLYGIRNLGHKSIFYLRTVRWKIRVERDKKYSDTEKKEKADTPEDNLLENAGDSLELLNLPQGIKNSLRRAGIKSFSQLSEKSEYQLRRIRGLGKKSIKLIQDFKSTRYMYKDVLIPVDRKIEQLGLPIRIENALKEAGIFSIDYLETTPREKLLKVRNIGTAALKTIYELRNNYGKQSGNKVIPSDKLLSLLLDRTGDGRNQEIILRRYGLLTGERETLEEIGKSFGLTRERIRQIQEKGFRRMRHPSTLSRKPIINIVEKLLFENQCLISDKEADLLLPKIFKKQPFDGSSLLDLFADLGWIQNHRIGDLSFYSPNLNGIKLIDFMEDIFEILKKATQPLSPEDILVKLPSIHKTTDQRINLTVLISKSCRLDPRIESKVMGRFSPYLMNDYTINLWIPLIVEVLEEAQNPLYYTEIAEKVNDKLAPASQRRLDVRRAQSLLITSPVFAHSGIRGTYGLVKWGFRKESTVELAIECIKKAGFPLHWKQIYNYVSKFKDSPKMNIRSILEQSGNFEKQGNGFYRVKE